MAIDFPNIDPVAFAIGPVEIRWYALAYMAGFVLGWQYCLYLAGFHKENQRPFKTDIDDFLPWAVLGVILGGRIGYVFFYQPELYWADPLEALRLWHGGMAFHGGITGLLIALLIFCRWNSIPVLRLSDMLARVAPIGLFFGRIANFINGELFGRNTGVSWAVSFPRGGDLPRHPSQLYEAGLEGLALFLILLALARFDAVRDRPGIISGAFLLGYGVFRFFVEFFREPDIQVGFIFEIFTMGQLLCLPMIIGGAGLILYAALRQKQA
ncbi:MAG: prolipoprotein diacylglyceryl transferase [Alphaproteobacteria bacterium]|nr:prolipoprotein diacylglyceryl transferase [Alphaproteobacteria bacterium]MCD8519735.1 prolipoprotein diacylglyceryl transferase [Alphaproteobacteria bacterium]MCD8571295.1 prolipoprotein diacylglyceryl transferase [Alphaproteobacteria bacterium]